MAFSMSSQVWFLVLFAVVALSLFSETEAADNIPPNILTFERCREGETYVRSGNRRGSFAKNCPITKESCVDKCAKLGKTLVYSECTSIIVVGSRTVWTIGCCGSPPPPCTSIIKEVM
ncbi:hypothetical protein MKW92_031411 [Papaver armeniacum]|nr:hypothetical protein MKW92_031411 [Papaver armeniacum]